ncbi:MAG: ABC transporter permease [Anaerolineae bacterium]
MKALKSLYLANAREFVRDRLALIITLIMPLMFALFFGMLFSGNNGGSPVALGLVAEDEGQAGQAVAAMLQSPDIAGIVSVSSGDLESQLEELRKGSLEVVLVLPAGLSESVGRGEQVSLPVYYNPERQASSGAGMGLVTSLVSQANLAVTGAPSLLTVEANSVTGTQPQMSDFYVPSMLGLAMLWLGVFGTAQPLVQMREQQVLRRLGVTPLSRRAVLGAQVAWRVTIGLAQSVLFLLMGYLAFDITLTGANVLLFPLVAVLGAVTFVTVGYFVAAISPTMESAIAIAQVVNFAMTFFSGSFFQPELLPAFMRPLPYLMPLTYLSDAFRQVMSGWQPFVPLGVDIAVLAGLTLVLVPLTIRFWRWE